MSQTADRKAALDDLADSLVADAQTAARALADHDRDVEGAAARAKQREIEARRAADDAVKAVADIVAHLEGLDAALERWDRASIRLAAWPSSMKVVSSRARAGRFGDQLSRRLYNRFRMNSLGRVTLNAGNNTMARDFVAGEHDLLKSLFARRDNGYDTDGIDDGGNGVAPAAE